MTIMLYLFVRYDGRAAVLLIESAFSTVVFGPVSSRLQPVPYLDGRQLSLNTYAIDLLPTLEALSSQHPRHNSSRTHTSGCER